MHRVTWWLAVLASACAMPVGEPDELTDLSEDGLISGQYTYQQAEVGSMTYGGGRCTATLFGSARTVLTAAHCVGYASSSRAGNYGSFTLEPRRGARHTYTIQRIKSFGSGPGPDDIALLQLSRSVPSSVARPAPPIGRAPSRGEWVTLYGYGCQERGTRDGSGRKQAMVYRWGSDTEVLCHGDSGGPTVTLDGEVIQVNSFYDRRSGGDYFADVQRNRVSLRAHVDAWRGSSALVWEAGATPAPPPADDGCGELSGMTEMTCLADGRQFASCDASGIRRAHCPDGSTCRPGSTEWACYR